MREPVRAIHFPSAASLEAVRARAQSALDSWARSWVSSGGAKGPELRVTLPTESQAALEYNCLQTKVGSMWVRRDRLDDSRLATSVVGPHLMNGDDCADSWVAEVVDEARRIRNRAICGALLGEPDSSGQAVVELPQFAVGSGAIQLTCEEIGLFAVVDASVWRLIPPVERPGRQRPGHLDSLEDAVRGAQARLDVVVGSVELRIPQLLDLRRGDVLHLSVGLNEGVAVLCEGRPLARALLGVAGRRKCARLIKLEEQ